MRRYDVARSAARAMRDACVKLLFCSFTSVGTAWTALKKLLSMQKRVVNIQTIVVRCTYRRNFVLVCHV